MNQFERRQCQFYNIRFNSVKNKQLKKWNNLLMKNVGEGFNDDNTGNIDCIANLTCHYS